MRQRRFVLGLTITATAVSLVAGGCSGGSDKGSAASQAAATASAPTLFVRSVLCTMPPSDRHVQITVAPESACRNSNPALIASTPTDAASAAVIVPFFMGGRRYALGPAELTARDVKSADIIETANLGYEVEVRLTAAGLQKFNRVAALRYPYYLENRANPPARSQEAIEVGDTVFGAFPIEAHSYRGAVVITAAPVSLDDAQYIAGVIKASV
jgi:hypothetical protein